MLLGFYLKSHRHIQIYLTFSPTLSLRSSVVFYFLVKSVLYFQLISVKGVRSVSRLLFFLIYLFIFACGWPFVPVDLICSSFPSFLRWKLRWLILALSSFLIYVFSTINLSIYGTFHKFWIVVFSFSSKYIEISSLTHVI